MQRFDQAELAPIHAALMAIPAGEKRDMALNKMCRVAQEADQRVRSGQAIEAHAEADELTKAVIGAVISQAKREAAGTAAPKPKFDLRKSIAKVAQAGLAKATIKPQGQTRGMAHTSAAMKPRPNRAVVLLAGMRPQASKQARRLDHRKASAATEARHKLDPEVVSKAIASLPLSKRAVAEVLRIEGDEEELKKWLGPALMAARAALPTVARAASSVGSKLFGARAGAKAAGGVMAGGRSAIRGAASAERRVKAGASMAASAGKKAWGGIKAGGAAALVGASAAADSFAAKRQSKRPPSATSPGRYGKGVAFKPGQTASSNRGWAD